MSQPDDPDVASGSRGPNRPEQRRSRRRVGRPGCRRGPVATVPRRRARAKFSSLHGGPLAAALFEATGSWADVFYVVAALDVAAALLALFVLRPIRAGWNNFRAMVTGYELLEEADAAPPAEKEAAHVG